MLNRKIILAAAAVFSLAACGDNSDENAARADGAAPAAGAGGDAATTQAKGSILDALSASQQHKSLANAVKAAGLTETLSGPTPYTVFAPTDAAFSALPGTTPNDLLAPDARGQLVALLTAHIVPGAVTAKDLAAALERGNGKAALATVGGPTLNFSREGDAIIVTSGENRARLAGGESLQSNGVIHSIDTVLMPAG